MVKIGNIKPRGRLVLAPMAGVTDAAFRAVCREHGAALTVTEMISAKALVYGDIKTKSLLALGSGEHPAGVQIFGSDPATMESACVIAIELSGADFIDINMGCPVGKISGSGDGCALMRDPEKAARIIERVVKNAGVPVTIKIRKGWDKGSVNACSFAKMAEEAGAEAIAVHGRTKVQMYSGSADWDIIREVKKTVKIPVIANGDVLEPDDARRILEYTGADLVMIGRGSFGNPWIFSRGNALLADEPLPPLPPLRDRIDTAMRQLQMAVQNKGERIAVLEARRHFSWYLRGVANSGYFKLRIVEADSLEQMLEIAEGIKRELR